MATDDKPATDAVGETDADSATGAEGEASAESTASAENAADAPETASDGHAAGAESAREEGAVPEPTTAAGGTDAVQAAPAVTAEDASGGGDAPSSTEGGEASAAEPEAGAVGVAGASSGEDASEAGAASSEDASEAGASDSAPAADQPAAGDDAAAADGAAAAGESGEAAKKKRRRRRRKRKKGAEAGEDEAGGDGAVEPPSGAPADEGKAAEGRRKSTRPERPAFSPGDQVFGKVSKVTEHALWIDIAGKATGLFDISQAAGEVPKAGDQFIAKVQSSSTRGGVVMLVTEPASATDAKAELRAALDSGEQVEGWVTGVIKGGVEVDFKGVRAFAPASHVELRPSSDLSHLLGRRLPFVVTHYAKKGRDIVVSRKSMLEESAEKERGEQLAKIEPGTLCQGIVRKVLGWGAFVALPSFGNVEGVVHMTEASHDRGAKLADVLKAGDEIEVKVLRVDEKGKLWLSRKGAQQDPWEEARTKYPQWSRHRGKVVRLTDFGAFIQLEAGIDGLCHVSDLAVTAVAHPKEVVSVGDELDVVVSHLDVDARKIGLHPAPPDGEQDEKRVRIQAHQTVKAEVVQIRDGGVAVRIIGATGRAQRAFIPANHTGTPRGTDLRKAFPLGKQVEAKVLDVDPRRGEARLSIRALKEDAEKQAYREYRKQVQREAHFGTFADLLKKS